MTSERFDVVLQGTTLRGIDVATVAKDLAKLIKRDMDFATRLLGGQPTRIKSGIDAAAGARYVEALERIGAAVRLEPATLEVDADLFAPATMGNQDETDNPTKSVGVTESVVAENKLDRSEQPGHAMGIAPLLVSGTAPSDPKGAALAWPRLWARQIDFVLCYAITVGLGVLVGATQLSAASNIFMLLAVWSLLSALAVVGYETLSLGAFGTTLGKAALGLRVETRWGTKIEFGRAMRRSFSVWWLGSAAYLFFPGVTLIAWWYSRRHLRKTGSTLWDDRCMTRLAGGPVPAWRATLAGVIAMTAFTLVIGLDAIGRKEMKREAQESTDRSFGLLPTPPITAAPRNSSGPSGPISRSPFGSPAETWRNPISSIVVGLPYAWAYHGPAVQNSKQDLEGYLFDFHGTTAASFSSDRTSITAAEITAYVADAVRSNAENWGHVASSLNHIDASPGFNAVQLEVSQEPQSRRQHVVTIWAGDNRTWMAVCAFAPDDAERLRSCHQLTKTLIASTGPYKVLDP